MISADLVGSWAGTNGFRLLAGDPLVELPATATVTAAAGGHLLVVVYTWQHPDDGPQGGLLLLAPTGEGDDVTATWGDSWHQQPGTMTLPGHRTADGAVSVEASYGEGWSWRITLEPGESGELLLQMDNVIGAQHATPEEPAGPYPVMVLRARRV